MTSIYKKGISILLIMALLGSAFVFPVQKAEAVGGGMARCALALLKGFSDFIDFDASKLGRTATQAVSGVISQEVPVHDKSALEHLVEIDAHTRSLKDKEVKQDSAMKECIAGIVEELVRSIVDWINSGFEGSPTFIEDPEGFFGNVADQTIGFFLEGAGLDFLCTPFKLDIQLALRQRYRPNYRAHCTPSRIAEVHGFTNQSFEEMGWDGWLDLTTRSENNIYASWAIANNDMNAAINYRVNSYLRELGWGDGFFTIKDPETGTAVTPGTLIVKQADRALGSNLEQLHLADEFDDIIYALINQLTNQLITKGLRKS